MLAAEEFEAEITVRDGVEAVGRYFGEVEQFGRDLAIDRIGRPGKRRRTERHDVGPFQPVLHPFRVARKHLVVGHQMVSEQHRLGPLQMGVTRHDDIDGLLGQFDKHLSQVYQLVDDSNSFIP